jgi:hypothetical protein
MIDPNEFLVRVIADLSNVRARMKTIARSLNAVFPKAVIRDNLEFAKYQDRHLIELYIDIALGEGKSLCWWIDIEGVRQVWNVEASLRRDDGEGEDSVWKARYQAATVEELFSQLSVVLDEMERFARQGGKNFI